MRRWNLRKLSNFFGCLLILILTACGTQNPPPATPNADPAATSLPLSSKRVLPESLPEVCNCTLRFDQISIEQGLSQSSVRVIFQDRLGFLWFGTEDGLNRYDGYNFKIFKPEPNNPNSLSNGWITAIAEDQDGFLWVGTNLGGLNRYNPVTGKFTQYLKNGENPNAVIDNRIRALLADRNNQLWIGTARGLDRLDIKTGVFHHYSFSISPGLDGSSFLNEDPSHDSQQFRFYPGISTLSNRMSSGSVTHLFEDSRGNLWIGTSDGGINILYPQDNIFSIYKNIPRELTTISSNRITAIAEDMQGEFWIGTNNGLNRFNPNSGAFSRYENNKQNPRSLADNYINALKTDSVGNLWIGTSNGLERLSKDYSQFIHYRNDPSFTKSMSNNFILSIFEDNGGVLWFGTYGSGVNKYDWGRSRFAYYRHDPNDPFSLSGNFIFPIYVDHAGVAWVGTYGEGLNRFDNKTGKIKTYFNDPKKSNSIGSNWLLSLYEDHEQMLWIGTNNGLDRFNPANETFTHYRHDPYKPDSLSGNTVYSVFEDSKRNLWVGTSAGLDRLDRDSGKFIHYTPDADDPESLSGPRPLAIMEDRDGYIWIGTSESGLNRFDPATNTFRQYHHNPQNNTTISTEGILSIYQDSAGRIWVGTAGGGLNLYNSERGTFTHYLEKDGLPNGFVYGILEDDLGYLWMSTNFGISRFDPTSKIFRNFDANDGLQSNEFDSGAYAKGKSGELYFGGINGLTVFHPIEITDNPHTPQVVLTSLTHDNQPIQTGTSVETARQVTLEYPQNSLEFEFAALSFNQPNKNQYAYFLNGFDTNWHYIGTKRDGRYTNLPGGEYTLLLKAANNNGVWNETPERIEIKVIPPFWQTTLFRILLGVILIGAVLGGIRLRTKSIEDQNRQLERLVRERTGALEKRNQEIQALYQADERILRNVSLQQVFQTLVDVAVDTLNADRSVVFAWNEKHTKIMPRVSRGFSAETLKVLEFEKSEGVIGRVFESGEAAFVRQIHLNDFRENIRDAIIAEGIRSFFHIPIIVDHKIVGVFNVGFTTPNLIGDNATRLFTALTQRAAISIANMELFEQTKDLAVMEERNRLARDLHDSAKQKAFAALAQLGTARGILNGHAETARLHLNEAENLVSDVIQELTFLVQEIYPIALQEKGLAASLREYVFEWENRNDIKVSLTIKNEKRMSLGLEQALYRVTQESLANIARHSRAQHVTITLTYDSDSTQLTVTDDGSGFDIDLKGHGLGLRSIRERVSSVNGNLQIQSAPGQGTKILISVPIENKKEALWEKTAL